MTDVSFQLNEDQLTLQKWIHDFAETTIRPAASEWDEREEFPWPIVQEAAKIGLYGLDFMANALMGAPSHNFRSVGAPPGVWVPEQSPLHGVDTVLSGASSDARGV